MITGHVFIATSLDGFIADADGGIDWLFSVKTEGEDHGYDDFIKDKDGIIMGRKTFEKALTFDPWPYRIPVIVLSQNLRTEQIPQRLQNLVTISKDTPLALMDKLEAKGWHKVYLDGGILIQSFLRAHKVQDMIITRIPVLLGSGHPLFGPLDAKNYLVHQRTVSFPSGLVQSFYSVKL